MVSTHRLAGRLLALSLGLSAVSLVHAEAPQVKSQAPGYYRLMLGSFEVTALSDGTVDLPVDQLLTNVKPALVAQILADNHLKAPLETSVNGYLINTGSKLVLVDNG
ncbi:MAG: beta-lactamase, partial [Rhizobacter sp.]|nr:beta-lactamase [Rhizobacter sp.]